MNILEIIELENTYMAKTFKRFPIAFEKGEGVYLYDTEGKKYVDFLSGIAVNSLGYNDVEVVKAIDEQSKKVMHTSNLFYSESQSIFAQKLVENSDFARVFFSNSGAEANECAIKLARIYFYKQNKQKYKIISLDNSFHGRTIATATLTGQPKYSSAFAPLVGGIVHIPINDFERLDATIDENVGAVFLEVIQGESGVHPCEYDYLQKVQALCREKDILLIVDEVQTGMGRCGKLFAYQNYDIKPDIITLAKGIANGFPMGATLFSEKLENAFAYGEHGSTFGGNHLACAVANVVFDRINTTEFLQSVNEVGDYLIDRLKSLDYAFIKEVRGKGLIVGLQLDTQIDGREIVLKLLEKGVVANCAGGNTLRFIPPLIVKKEHIDVLIEALIKIFDEV